MLEYVSGERAANFGALTFAKSRDVGDRDAGKMTTSGRPNVEFFAVEDEECVDANPPISLDYLRFTPNAKRRSLFRQNCLRETAGFSEARGLASASHIHRLLYRSSTVI